MAELTECECYKLLKLYVDELKAPKEYSDVDTLIRGRDPELAIKLRKIAGEEMGHQVTLEKAINDRCRGKLDFLRHMAQAAKKCEE